MHAGIRHFLWDYGAIPNQVDKTSMFELEEVKRSSEFILYGSAGLTLLLAMYYYTV
jgi:succinate dehydrogenase/fumarate reductase cytochrome b subunit